MRAARDAGVCRAPARGVEIFAPTTVVSAFMRPFPRPNSAAKSPPTRGGDLCLAQTVTLQLMHALRKRRERSPAPEGSVLTSDSQRSPLSNLGNTMAWTPMPPAKKTPVSQRKRTKKPARAGLASPEAVNARLLEQANMFEDIDNYVRAGGLAFRSRGWWGCGTDRGTKSLDTCHAHCAHTGTLLVWIHRFYSLANVPSSGVGRGRRPDVAASALRLAGAGRRGGDRHGGSVRGGEARLMLRSAGLCLQSTTETIFFATSYRCTSGNQLR